jgi:hypothetical protein
MTPKQQIKKLFGIDELNYGLFLMDAGYYWLKHFWNGNEENAQIFARTKCFWDWWSCQFEKRNGEFINDYSISTHPYGPKAKDTLWLLFRQTHFIKPDKQWPGKVILRIIVKEAKDQHLLLINQNQTLSYGFYRKTKALTAA